MAQYTIAERQAIKERLADEKYFAQDFALFAQLFPHHVLIGECKRVNNLNRISLCRRMIYQMLLKVDEAAILENREHDRTNEAPKGNRTASMSDIRGNIRTKVSGWVKSIREAIWHPQS